MPDRKDDLVVLLHGLGRTSGSMRLLARRVEKAGYRTACIRYPGTRQPLDVLAADLEPRVHILNEAVEGRVHFVTHSMGGLVVRALLARYRPAHLGRVVMLAPPHGGSEWADVLQHLRLASRLLGPNSRHLVTQKCDAAGGTFGTVDYPLGIVAGDRPVDRVIAPWLMPRPHDGKVSVASTRLEGMADHIVLPVGHPFMPFHPLVARQAIAFLEDGAFARR